MKTIKKRFVIIALTFMLIACVAALFTGVGEKTAFATQVLPTEPINQSYALGEVFTPSDAKITYKGVEYDASVVSVNYPNGKAYKTDSYVLEVPGEYKVNYSAIANGTIVHASVIFNVSGSAYDVGGSNSSASYTTIDNTDKDGNLDGETTSGLMVKLAFGDKFTYKKPINLNGKTKADKLLEFFVVPKNLGNADARVLKIRLTDAYDPNNYVDIVTYGNYGDEDEVKLKAGEITSPGNPGWALYSACGAAGQPLTGLHYKAPEEPSPNAIYYLDGRYTVNHNIVYNSGNGYPSYDFSLVARNGYGKGLYSIAMDYAEKRVYGPKPSSSASNGIIADLDEPLFFENLWEGFTTGEAYLSIWADSYVSSTFDFIIQSIDGNSLQNPHYVDGASPTVEVDTPKTGVPNAVVGEEYKLFNAVANDAVDGKLDVSTYVYKNYYSSRPTGVKIKDSTFKPDTACTYTIVYKAVDSAGNAGIKLVDVVAQSQSNLSLTLSGGEQVAKAGIPFTLKTPSISGAFGDYTVKVNAICGDKNYEVQPDENGVYKFLPMNSGEYTIEYYCEDYNVSVSDRYSITVSANTVPVIIDEVYLPPVFVNEIEYVFPEFIGYDFSDGTPVVKKAQISYAFDGGELQSYTAGQKVKINAVDSVSVVYSVGDSSESKKTYVVPVQDVSGTKLNGSKTQFNIKNYFYGEDFTNFTVEEENGVNYKTTENSSSLIFVNKLLATQFSTIFTIKEYAAEKIVFTLTDSLVKSEKLTVELTAVDQSSLSIRINGGEQRTISLPLVNNQFKFEYDMQKNQIKFGGIYFPVEKFNGFSSKLAYFEMKLEGNTSATTVNFESINEQGITDNYNEYSKPKYYLVMNSNQKAVGDKLVISDFIAQDVIIFESQIKLSLKDKSGNALTATNGTVMNNVSDFSKEYEIVFDKVGEYSLTYSVSDGYNTEKKTVVIYVKDNIPPQITLKEAATLAKVGSNVTIANYQVTDPTDTNVSVRVCVQRPDMGVVNLSGRTFKADIKGTYTVMYFVTDATGNSAFAFYEVVVK